MTNEQNTQDTLTNEQKVQATFEAYYARQANPAELRYWVKRLEERDGDLTKIVDEIDKSVNCKASRSGLF